MSSFIQKKVIKTRLASKRENRELAGSNDDLQIQIQPQNPEDVKGWCHPKFSKHRVTPSGSSDLEEGGDVLDAYH